LFISVMKVELVEEAPVEELGAARAMGGGNWGVVVGTVDVEVDDVEVDVVRLVDEEDGRLVEEVEVRGVTIVPVKSGMTAE